MKQPSQNGLWKASRLGSRSAGVLGISVRRKRWNGNRRCVLCTHLNELSSQASTQGNAFFRNEQYREASSCYSTMCDVEFTKPVYFSNLSAAYLKLGESVNRHYAAFEIDKPNRYDSAIKSSTVALILDPTHKKSRFRRLQARKALGFHRGALSDAQTILRLADLDDPTLPDIRYEVKVLCSLLNKRPTSLCNFNDNLESIHICS